MQTLNHKTVAPYHSIKFYIVIPRLLPLCLLYVRTYVSSNGQHAVIVIAGCGGSVICKNTNPATNV